ncbi:MAG: hypothetical protein U0324_46175 [Polyangiales bacterium]
MTGHADLRAFLARPATATAARRPDGARPFDPHAPIIATTGQRAFLVGDGQRRWNVAPLMRGRIGRVVHLGARLAVYLHVPAVRHGGNVEAAAARGRYLNARVTVRRDFEGRAPDGPRVAGVVSQVKGLTFAVVFKVLVQTRDAESLAELDRAAAMEPAP